MTAYLDAWVAGLLLGGVAVAHWLVDRRLVGVSGFVTRTSRWLLDPSLARDEDRAIRADPEALRRALLEATDGELGDVPFTPARRPSRLLTNRAAALYLLAIVVGGAIASLQRGSWSLSTTLGPTFVARWGDGPLALVPLLLGGVLVGAGARMAGGCSSGHGLAGCARLQPASVLATATFMAAGVATTFVLKGLG